jgi:hypothetical protein
MSKGKWGAVTGPGAKIETDLKSADSVIKVPFHHEGHILQLTAEYYSTLRLHNRSSVGNLCIFLSVNSS